MLAIITFLIVELNGKLPIYIGRKLELGRGMRLGLGTGLGMGWDGGEDKYNNTQDSEIKEN